MSRKLYNKIEVVCSYDVVQTIGSDMRKQPDALNDVCLDSIMKSLQSHALEDIIMYMNTDKSKDKYFYKYEFTITRQKQNNDPKTKEEARTEP